MITREERAALASASFNQTAESGAADPNRCSVGSPVPFQVAHRIAAPVAAPVSRRSGTRAALPWSRVSVRAEVVKALRLLKTKRETLPPKKHGNIPL